MTDDQTESGVITAARTRTAAAGRAARRVARRIPGTVRAVRARAVQGTSALQALPDSTLRSLAASSVGLGAGFYLAGAPRLVVMAGVVPAVLMRAAITLRPTASAPDVVVA